LILTLKIFSTPFWEKDKRVVWHDNYLSAFSFSNAKPLRVFFVFSKFDLLESDTIRCPHNLIF
jgi:hypothetical protein